MVVQIAMINESECVDILVPLGWSDWQARLGFHANFCCEYCDRDLLVSVHDYDAWHVDHIVPMSKGGVDEQWNRALSCKVCNFVKSNRVFTVGIDVQQSRAAAIAAIRHALVELRSEKQARLARVREHFRREGCPMPESTGPVISVMLAVPDAPRAAKWYCEALGAEELWNFGSVIGLEILGAPFFLGEPTNNGWDCPERLGMPSARIEVFCDEPDKFIARAEAAGADGSVDRVRNHQTPWGIHRQGGFVDPFGHRWLVGDRSPLRRYRG
jgi:uncharacterized glyoxalase superfamily protein PhnB